MGSLKIEPLTASVTKAVAVGSMGRVVGAAAVDLRLSALAGSGRSLIIDLAQVSFLSSMGIRSIVMSAKAVALRRAKLVLLSPDKNVEMVLTSTGIDTLVPIRHDVETALTEIGTAERRRIGAIRSRHRRAPGSMAGLLEADRIGGFLVDREDEVCGLLKR